MHHIEGMYLPKDFIAKLPKPVKDKIEEYDVLDFAFERYKQVFPDFKLSSLPQKFFVPYGSGEELLFDFSSDSTPESHARKPTPDEIRERNKFIPVLPDKWYNAFLYRLGEPLLTENKKKRDLSQIKTLAVFDFDHTLYKSPEAPKGHKGNWHIKPESLPDNPKEKDWNLDIVNKAQELCEDPSVYCVMMTGRVGNVFGDKIDNYFKQRGLNFAKTFYNEFGGDTADYKIETIHKLLNKLPNVQSLVMWDDDRKKAEKYSEEFADKINYKIHMVGDEELNESKFEEVKYDLSNAGLIKTKVLYILIDTKNLINFVSKLPKDNPDMEAKDLIDNKIILSYAAVTPNSDLDSPCMGATERTVLAQNPNLKGSGLGRYMMRLLFKFYPNGMVNDRSHVSKYAKDATRLMALSGITKVKKIKDGDVEIDKLDNKDKPKTATPEDDCKVHNDDVLDKVYVYDDPSIDVNKLLQNGEKALASCAKITNGDWPEHALEDLIITAGMQTFYMSSQDYSLG